MTFLRSFVSMFLIGLTVGAVSSCGEGRTGVEANGASSGSLATAIAVRVHDRAAARAPAPVVVTMSAERIIAAARTPDGRPIPQGSGTGGACPDVVAVVGFWSCGSIGDKCSYASDGVMHQCSCSPMQGQGALPSWTCS